ncbi:MAG: secondary thiamine-phosphate synthase enzyme [Bradymonadia bacterium]|jgi:secondary thiamine-phosphate synthase enzyme
MLIQHREIVLTTAGRGTYDITSRLRDALAATGVAEGLCNVFVHHTSASLLINEAADPAVQVDLESWMGRLVKDGDAVFTHRDEGPDDMSAHVRSVLTATTLSVPVRNGELDLGRWQGIFLWEHRAMGHSRRITLTALGEARTNIAERS